MLVPTYQVISMHSQETVPFSCFLCEIGLDKQAWKRNLHELALPGGFELLRPAKKPAASNDVVGDHHHTESTSHLTGRLPWIFLRRNLALYHEI